MSFVVELSPTAKVDLERLFEFLLDRSETTEDLDRAQAAIDAMRATAQHRLAITSFASAKRPRTQLRGN
jgi:plasmid stabilization system protein ParE